MLSDGVILKSQANLVASLGAGWSDETLALARRLLGRISAEQAARLTREVRAVAPAQAFAAIAEVASSFGIETASSGESEGSVRTASFAIAADQAASLADRLVEAGATSASVVRADYVFRQQSPLYDLLTARLASV